MKQHCKKDWVDLRNRKVPVITPPVYYFIKYDKDVFGDDFYPVMVQINEDGWVNMLFNPDLFNRAKNILFHEIENSPRAMEKRLADSRDIGEEWLKFCRSELVDEILPKSSDKDLVNLLNEYFDYYPKFSLANVVPWIFFGDYLFEQTVSDLKDILDNNQLIKLSTPNSLTFSQEFELDFQRLLLLCKREFNDIGDASQLKAQIKNNKEINKKFNQLVKKYYWIPFDYVGPDIWDEKYMISALFKDLVLTEEQIGSKILDIEKYITDLAKEQNDIISKHKLDNKFIQRFNDLKILAILQDEKKAITSESHYHLGLLFNEIASRTGLDKSDLYFLSIKETSKLILDKNNFTDEIKARKKLSFTIVNPGEIKIYSGEKAKEMIKEYGINLSPKELSEDIDIIKGAVGSPGNIRGKVKILLTPQEADKIVEGDIIVATMTTPDYVPAMKKASAFITDEGGITCHAAIIAREMKKPCIIATKIATKVLKDGDEVEVDANEGVVRKIK